MTSSWAMRSRSPKNLVKKTVEGSISTSERFAKWRNEQSGRRRGLKLRGPRSIPALPGGSTALAPVFRNRRDGFLFAFHWQQELPVHVRSRWNIPYIRRRAVIPDHAVGEHGKIVPRRVFPFPEGTPAIDGVADHQVAIQMDSGPLRRKDPRPGNVVS